MEYSNNKIKIIMQNKTAEAFEEIITEKAQHLTNQITNLFSLISEQLGLPSEQLLQICLVICLILALIGTFEQLIVNLVGILYPVFKSVQALENDNIEESNQWLTYWICFACFLIFD